MPLSRRLSRSEMSLHSRPKCQEGSLDGSNLKQDLAHYSRSVSKSDPPKIYVEDEPLIDDG